MIVKENAVIGDISWSPNDQYFVFSAAENIIAIGETDDFSVFRVGVDDLSLKRVYSHGDKFLTNPEWVSENDIIYETWFGDQQIILNIETGAVTEVEQ